MFGWRGRLLRVDLASGAITKEVLDPDVARNYLGGRGLAGYLHSETAPSEKNPLIFATGPLTGSLAPNGGRFTVLTRAEGRIAAASVSGKWGPELKYAGFDAVIFEGKAADPVYLWVRDGNAELRGAAHVSGKTVSETTRTLLKETDEKAIVSSIGPAGENRVGCALVVGDAYSGAGGTGAGAVMGSKNLKAVVVRGLQGFRLADSKRFLRSATELRSWMSKRSIAAKGSLQHGSVLMAANLEWDEPIADIKPARTRGCFGCATSFSHFVCDGDQGFLRLSAGSPPEMLFERLKEYRSFVDLGLDFAAAKEFLASQGKQAAGSPLEQARILASGLGTEWEGGIDAEIDHGPCIAAGYALVPRIDSGSVLAAVLDSAGLCPYLVAGISMETIAELLYAATGSAFTQDELVRTGQRISGAEDTQRGG